jgi:4,5-DOPA dioxygenase extradiol
MHPALFVSHGAPTLPFDDVPARDFLRGLGGQFAPPKAVVCVSAHWDTDAPELNTVAQNGTIHDFYGFPEELYRVRYDAPGAPQLARDVETMLHGSHAQLDETRGLDHGAWVPLMLMYPDAKIPVIQLSVQSRKSPAHHIALGKTLGALRSEGILILGSGGFVHNLRALDRSSMSAPEPVWSADFGSWMHNALSENRESDLASYRALAPHAAIAHPSEEHLMPLFVAYGAGNGKTERLHTSTTFGSLRMDAYAFN